MYSFISFILSCTLVYALVYPLRRLAFRFDILDYPGARTIHKGAIPLVGGLAVFLGVIPACAFNFGFLRGLLPIFAGGAIIFMAGFIDDVRGFGALPRLFFQIAAALTVIGAGIKVEFMPSCWWKSPVEILVTLVWLVGVTNACNYLDGMDGLAAGSIAINLFSFAVILYSTKQDPIGMFLIILIGACLGFLPHNLRKEKTFLGDSGSMFLGFVLAAIAISGAWASDNIVKIFIPVLILGVPIFDMTFTTIMRIAEGKVRTPLQWLRYGDRDHFHHYLVDIGLTPGGAVIFIYFITLSLGIHAMILTGADAPQAFLALLEAAIIFGAIATLMVVGKRRRSGRAGR